MMKIRFVAFDLDGVLVDIRSSWCWVHEHFGVNNDLSLRAYLDGKIDDREFMRRDIALWLNKRARLHISEIEKILAVVPRMPGAKETFAQLRSYDIKTAVISSGLDLLAKQIGVEFGIDYVLANGLQTCDDGFLTGEGILNVGLRNKGDVLRKLMRTINISSSESAAVGDSFIDTTMFDAVKLKIAFNPEDELVRAKADVIILEKDLTKILPYIHGEL